MEKLVGTPFMVPLRPIVFGATGGFPRTVPNLSAVLWEGLGGIAGATGAAGAAGG